MLMDVLLSFLYLAAELIVLFFAVSLLVHVMQGMIPVDRIFRLLEGRSFLTGAGLALFAAFITPFCSCSTIPFVAVLLQKKVRFGIVMVFLFASPVLDPTIITLMAVLLGAKVAVAYTLITAGLAVITGWVLEKSGFQSAVKQIKISGFSEEPGDFSWKGAWASSVKLLKTVFPYLVLGAAIGSVIQGAVPDEWLAAIFSQDSWWLVPLAAVIGIPLYIRLSAMIPVSSILLAKGMAIAPVMALIISSAGASLPEIALLSSIFHKRLVTAFVASVIMISTLSGFLFYLI